MPPERDPGSRGCSAWVLFAHLHDKSSDPSGSRHPAATEFHVINGGNRELQGRQRRAQEGGEGHPAPARHLRTPQPCEGPARAPPAKAFTRQFDAVTI